MMLEDAERNLEQPLQPEDAMDRFLTFALDDDLFGLAIADVTEIIGMQDITPLPEVPEHIRGIINLRGKIVPVVDMRMKFALQTIEYTERTCIIVVELEEISCGLIVDRVADVTDIAHDKVVAPPEYQEGKQNRYVYGIGKIGENIVLLLDTNKILETDTTSTSHF